MPIEVATGQTNYTKQVQLLNTDGTPATGKVAADLIVSYSRTETDNDVVETNVTSSVNDLSALTDAHTDWGVKEVQSSRQPGVYRFDFADEPFATGADQVVVTITGTGLIPKPIGFFMVPSAPYSGVDVYTIRGATPESGTDVATALFTQDTGETYSTAVDGSVVKEIADNAAGGGGGGGASASAIADAVWDELTSGHAVSGSFGALVVAIAGYLDTEIAALPAAARDAVFAQVIENSKSFLECLRILNANAAGDIVGANTNNMRIKSLDGAKDRITADASDTDGNRNVTAFDVT